ncbi:MAG: DUF58 domain-containing protein [Chloroflexi bacterium]|nr:DUF58 domain-containing protein [Chloroflexota bacterium]MCL5075576.1 DUF58 domain-containing protein [Chloroflexota bacterium]
MEERFSLENMAILPKLWVEIKDHSTLPQHQVSRVFNLPPKTRKAWTVRTTCTQRGKYTLGPLSIVGGDPFGLFKKVRLINEQRMFIVYPGIVDLPHFSIPGGELMGGITVREHSYEVTPNASSIREYRPEDSFNRIHWPSTARMGRLMTKEFDFDPYSDIWIILDMQARVQVGSGMESTEEVGVTAAASIANHFLLSHRSVGFVSYADQHRIIPADRGSRQLLKILEELAVIKGIGWIPISQVIATESKRFGRRSTLITITPSLNEAWPNTLREVARQGVKAVAILLEPSTFGSKESALLTIGALAAAEIPTFLIKKGDALDKALTGYSRTLVRFYGREGGYGHNTAPA